MRHLALPGSWACFLYRSCLFLYISPLTSGNQVAENGNPNQPAFVYRHHQGDLYIPKGNWNNGGDGLGGENEECRCIEGSQRVGPPNECQCQCQPNNPALRDDRTECISDLSECALVDFVGSSRMEKIPFVFLPAFGKLVHRTAEIALYDLSGDSFRLVSPVCLVTKAKVLFPTGWRQLQNSTNSDAPFRLFRDSGKTYLQWVGDEAMKEKTKGRLVLVQLLCRDTASPHVPLFRPCVALRIASTPDQDVTMYKDVKGEAPHEGLSTSEAAALGVVLTVLLIAYVITSLVCIYNRQKRRKDLATRKKISEKPVKGILPSSIETKKSAPEKDTIYGIPNQASRLNSRSRFPLPKTSLVSSEEDSDIDDIEDLCKKSTPDMFFTTSVVQNSEDEEEDIYSIPSKEEENEGRRQRLERIRMEIQKEKGLNSSGDPPSVLHYEAPTSSLGLSIVENEYFQSNVNPQPILSPSNFDGKSTNERAVNKKLYFNPAYLDPENLQVPPPGAMEFLSKIRGMISVAKTKLRTKSFQPELFDIPEDDYSLHNSRTPSTICLSRSHSIVSNLEESNNDGSQQDILDSNLDSTSPLSEIVVNKIMTEGTLERGKRIDEANRIGMNFKSSTLKKLAKRVNSQGQSVVGELIKTLDVKPRLPETHFIPKYKNQSIYSEVPPVSQTDISLAPKTPQNGETDFPELVRPSLLRRILIEDRKNQPDTTVTFEDFTQEMRESLNKIKHADVLSLQMPPFNQSYSGNLKSSSRVQEWLHSLDDRKKLQSGNVDGNHVVFDSKSSLRHPINNSNESHIGTYKPTIVSRAMSFYQAPEPPGTEVESISSKTSSLSRSHSWQADEIKKYTIYGKNSPRIPTPISRNQEENHFNDILTVQTKIPNATSGYSDDQCYLAGSLTISDNGEESLSLTRLTKLCEENKILNHFVDDHAYEEVKFGTGPRSLVDPQRRELTSAVKNHIKEIHVGEEETDEEGICSIYSNPDSLVSEIHIPGEVHQKTSNNLLSIEVNNCEDVKGQTNKSNRKKVKRSDSIVQDSLERPKNKKKNAQNIEEYKEGDNKELKIALENTEKYEDKMELTMHKNLQTDNPIKVKRSKTMMTFKDYQDVKFSLANSGFKLNFSEPSNEVRPPLPPKKLKSLEDIPSSIKQATVSDIFIENQNCSKSDEFKSPKLPHKLRKMVMSKKERLPELPPKMVIKNKLSLESSHVYPSLRRSQSVTTSGNTPENQVPPTLPKKVSKQYLNSKPSSNKNRQSWPEYGKLVQSSDDKNNTSVSSKIQDSFVISESLNVDCEDKMKLERSHSDSDMKINLKGEEIKDTTSIEKIVSGEFILSNDKFTTNPRQKSSPEWKLFHCIDQVTSEFDKEAQTNGIEASIAQEIRTDLEKYLKEKTGSESIKRSWRKLLEKLDANKDKGKLTLKDIRRFILEMRISDKESKDSGYHSTDSGDSYKIMMASKFARDNMINPLNKKPASTLSSTFKNSKGFLQRSLSLQQLLPPVGEANNSFSKEAFLLKRSKFTASIGRKFASSKISLYKNENPVHIDK